MAFRWWREIPQLLLIIAMFGVSALAWAAAPDLLPVHWNAAGEIDRYGSKAEALLTVPAIATVIYLVLLAAPRLARATEAQLGRLYLVVRYLVLLMLVWVHILLVLQIGGTPLDPGRLIPVSIGLLFAALGSFMGRVEPNAIMGVRTPWTLSSRAAWDDSQRLGGRLFMVLGVLLIAAGMLSKPWFTVTVLALLPISIIALVWRGYVVCKTDPDRLPPGQTLISSP